MLKKLICRFPPELRLLLASASSDIDETKSLLQQPIDWDKFLRLADNHRVFPSVYRTFSRLDEQLVPGHVLDVLKQKCQENTLSTLRITGEMVRIGSLLEGCNIRAVMLKGAPLSWRFYGDIAARPYSDIDMLVMADKLEQSIAILENEGYRRISDYDSYNLTPRQLQIYLKHKHSSHFEYWNSEKKVLLEIHWKLSKGGNVLPFTADGNTKKMLVAGNTLTVLADNEWLLYLVLHGAGHRWRRLRWLVDIKLFIQQENFDWASLNRLAEKLGIQSFLHQALILVNQVFGVILPPDLEQKAARDRTALRMAALTLQAYILSAGDEAARLGTRFSIVNHNYKLYMNRGFKNKLNYILGLLGPKAEDIKLFLLPDNLYALYYIISPVASFTRSLRRLVSGNKHVKS